MEPESLLRVRATVAPLLAEPRISTVWTSQLLCGSVVSVLDVQGDWRRIRGEDAYEGWMHVGYLEPARGDEHQWRLSLGCTVRAGSGNHPHDMPLMARVPAGAVILSGEVVEPTERATRFPAKASAVASSAERLFAGASYVWGGVTPWGCDCSGFVQSVYRLHGTSLPRDASAQAGAGALNASAPLDSLQPADLAFFSDRDDRRITHVGIILDDARMAHSGLGRGGFNVESLRDVRDPYVQRLTAQYVGALRYPFS